MTISLRHFLSGKVVELPPLASKLPRLRTGTPPLSRRTPPLSEGSNTPEGIAPDLWLLAEPVRQSQRAKPERVQAMIAALCAERYLTVQQLAQLLGRRSAEKLHENHLSVMVKQGRLALRFPETPNHPEQAYRAANEAVAGDAA